jgi:isoleucyl-tRNA synthetase
MSKSIGNTISPLDVVAKSGADIVRLWVASADYGQDVNVSDEILTRTSESYRRLRNAFRFMLSNLYDFDPTADSVAFDDMPELDRWALAELEAVLGKVTALYDEWRFYLVVRAISDYVGDLSSIYMDVVKDRLYADARDGVSRRSAQTALARILSVLVRVLAPVLAFTCEEVWDFMPAGLRTAESVHLADWPMADLVAEKTSELRTAYGVVVDVREVVTRALEEARNDKRIGKSQEASVVVVAPADMLAVLNARPAGALAELFIVASVTLSEGAELSAEVSAASGDKCPRCWNLRKLGVDPSHPEVCERCASVLSLLERRVV